MSDTVEHDDALTVRQLIALLQRLPPESKVHCRTEAGYVVTAILGLAPEKYQSPGIVMMDGY